MFKLHVNVDIKDRNIYCNILDSTDIILYINRGSSYIPKNIDLKNINYNGDIVEIYIARIQPKLKKIIYFKRYYNIFGFNELYSQVLSEEKIKSNNGYIKNNKIYFSKNINTSNSVEIDKSLFQKIICKCDWKLEAYIN